MVRAFISAGLVLILIPGMVSAAEYSAEPALYMSTFYNDNVHMASTNEDNSSGYTLEPGLKLKAEEQIWNVILDSRYRANRYPDVDNADSENAFFNLSSAYRTELQSFSLNGKYEKNTTLDTVFDTQLAESGLTTTNVERKTRSLSPSWSWQFSEAWYLSLNLDSTRVSYDELNTSGLRDYETRSVGIGLSWQLNETSQLGLNLSRLDYKSIKSNFKFEQPALQLTYVNQVSETDKLTASAGRWKIASTFTNQLISCDFFILGRCLSNPVFGDVDLNDRGNTLGLNYKSNNQTGYWELDANRSINPSGYGTAQQNDRLTWRLNYRVSERQSLGLLLDGSKTKTVEGANTSQDRTNYRIQPSWNWKLDKQWNLGIRYYHIKQELTDSKAVSEANVVYLTLFMNWPRLVSSY